MFCDFINFKDLKGNKVGFNKNQLKTLLISKDKVIAVINFIGKVEFPTDVQYTLKQVEIKDSIELKTTAGAFLKVNIKDITAYQQKDNGTANIAVKYLGIANISFQDIEKYIETKK